MKIKYILLVGIILFTGLNWYMLYSDTADNLQTYAQNMELAQEYDENEFYADAILCYQKALEIKPDEMSVKRAIALDYYNLKNYSKFVPAALEYNSLVGGDLEMYTMLISYYISDNDLMRAFSYIDEAYTYFPDNAEVTKLYDSIKGNYRSQGTPFSKITEFRDGYAIYTYDSCGGIISSDGTVKTTKGKYEEIAGFNYDDEELIFSACKDGKYNFYDRYDYLRVSPSVSYDYLGTFCDGYALVCKDGKWGYINENFEEKNIEYDNATQFINEIAAVQKNGKWALINDELQYVTEFVYEDVLVDDYNTCAVDKRIFVKQNGKYYMMNRKLEVLSKALDDAKPFVSDSGNAAVCIDGKWGLMNRDGELIIKCQYEDMGSSNEGFAPYKMNGKWGYVTERNEVLIEPVFEGAKAFNSLGYAAVKGSTNWYLIQLSLYED